MVNKDLYKTFEGLFKRKHCENNFFEIMNPTFLIVSFYLMQFDFSSISSAQNAICVILLCDIVEPKTGILKDVTKTWVMKICGEYV